VETDGEKHGGEGSFDGYHGVGWERA
jgi:hypothetical protein